MNTKPEEPSEADCCGSGCDPCVFDVYKEKLKKWENNQINDEESIALNPVKYLPFIILSVTPVSSDTNMYEFQAVEMKNCNKEDIIAKNAKLDSDFVILSSPLFLKVGEYLILKGKSSSELQRTSTVSGDIISRPYTPLLDKNCSKNGIFKTIITLYEKGLMSSFIRNLVPNDIVFWRGPYKDFEYPTNTFQHFFLIGGGTGIVPLYNIAKDIAEYSEKEIWIHMIASFKSVSHILLRKELNNLKQYWNFKIDVFISSQHCDINYSLEYGESFSFQRIQEDDIAKNMKTYDTNNTFVVICGPQNFNEAMNNYVQKYVVKENISTLK